MKTITKSLIVIMFLGLVVSFNVALADSCPTSYGDMNSDLSLDGLTSDQAIAVINAKYDAIIADPSTYSSLTKPVPLFPAEALNPVFIGYVDTYNTQVAAMVAGMNTARQSAIDEYNAAIAQCNQVTQPAVPATYTVSNPTESTSPQSTSIIQPPVSVPTYAPPTPPAPVVAPITDTVTDTTTDTVAAPVVTPVTPTHAQHKKKVSIPVINYTVPAVEVPIPVISTTDIQTQSAKVDQNWFQSVLQSIKNFF